MKTLVVLQHKGGVGKTTCCRLLSEYFARKGVRTLGIDLDGQASYSKRFIEMDFDESTEDLAIPPIHNDLLSEGIRSSSAEIYSNNGYLIPYPTAMTNLDVIPAYGEKLRSIEMQPKNTIESVVHNQLHSFLQTEDVKSHYDLVIVDTPPAKGPLTVSALKAATHILVPVQLEYQSIEGLQGMIQMWRTHNRSRSIDNPIHLVGILPNKFRNVSLHAGMLEALKNDDIFSSYILPVSLGERIAFAEVDHPNAKPKSIFDMPSSDVAKKEASAMCKIVEEKLEL